MIEVTLYYDADELPVGYEFSGHADSAPYGEDLVCAAASTLAIVTENSLAVQGVCYEAEMDDGYVKLMLTPQVDARHALIAEAVLKTLAVGAESLAGAYSEYIEVKSLPI